MSHKEPPSVALPQQIPQHFYRRTIFCFTFHFQSRVSLLHHIISGCTRCHSVSSNKREKEPENFVTTHVSPRASINCTHTTNSTTIQQRNNFLFHIFDFMLHVSFPVTCFVSPPPHHRWVGALGATPYVHINVKKKRRVVLLSSFYQEPPSIVLSPIVFTLSTLNLRLSLKQRRRPCISWNHSHFPRNEPKWMLLRKR